MRKISDAFKSRLYDDDYRQYIETVKIDLKSGTSLEINNSDLWGYGLCIDDAMSNDNSLDIGSAIIGMLQFKIQNLDGTYNQYNFEDAKIVPSIGLTLANGKDENIKMGEFYVVESSHDVTCVTLKCYDAMYKFDQPIEKSALTYPATLNTIISDACTCCGVPLKSGTTLKHGTYVVKEKPDGQANTFRNLIAWAGQICGQNARITVDGKLEFTWYDADGLNKIISGEDVSDAHNFKSTFGAPTVSLNDVTVTQINVSEKVVDEEGNETIANYTHGVTGYTISIENNELVQGGYGDAISQWLYNDLYGFRFRKASFSIQSDPSIQAGDIACLHDRKGNTYAVLVSSTKFQVGNPQQIVSAAAEPERTTSSRSSQEVKNYVNMLRSLSEERAARTEANKTVIEYVEANYVATDYLTANYINAEAIDAKFIQSERILTNQIDAQKARIDSIETNDLTAIHANIGTLDAGFANITSILSGNIGTGQLQTINLTAANTTVSNTFTDKILANYAIIQNLVAGNINTDNVSISSSDGSLHISGSVQQFKDDNGTVRIQIGKDAQSNYSFSIFDSGGNPVWYNDGITADGIPDGILVDDMVASVGGSYSGISANKLNISSVKGAIEEGGFSSSLIYFDDTGQTLNQVYTSMSSDISVVSDTATQAKSSADATAGKLKSIEEMVSGIDTLEGMNLMLTNEAHVVHTYYDGTGGNYNAANTQVVVTVGETDVTTQAIIEYAESSSVTGTWNDTAKTYKVENLSDMDGYVDFFATYGAQLRFLASRSGNIYTTRSGNRLKLPSGAAHLSKRFSISKSPDGKVGTTYDIHASVLAITRNNSNVLSPSSVTFYATQNDGSITTDYSGIFKIEETTDNSTYIATYTSSTAESSKTYIPSSSNLKGIRATLYDLSNQMLDIQSVVIIADADEMQTEIAEAKEAIQTLNTKYGEVKSGIDGLTVDLGQTTTELHGLSNGTLLFQTPFTWSSDRQIANFKAVVYRAGTDVTDEYADKWFEWFLRTEEIEQRIANGKTCTVKKSDLGYGGTVVGRFTTYNTKYLTVRSGNYLTTRSGNRFTVFTDAS